MGKSAGYKDLTKKSKAGHVAVIREHLAERLISHARSLHENPFAWPEVIDFMEDLPELLSRFENIGQEESEEVGHEMPYCFGVRILRITEVVKKVHCSTITRITAPGDLPENMGKEVACILAHLGSHIDRLTVNMNEDRPYYRLRDLEEKYVELFDSPIVSTSGEYVPLRRLNGGVGSWNRMKSLVDGCSCLLCSAQVAGMIGCT